MSSRSGMRHRMGWISRRSDEAAGMCGVGCEAYSDSVHLLRASGKLRLGGC